jgi:DNA-binding beta-propeller fold protein YncE
MLKPSKSADKLRRYTGRVKRIAAVVLALAIGAAVPFAACGTPASRFDELRDANFFKDGGGVDPNAGDADILVEAGSDSGRDRGPPPPPCGLDAITLKLATLSGCDTNGEFDGPRAASRFDNPTNVLIDPANGNTYVTDFDGSTLRVVTPDGTVTTVIDDVNFHRPFGLALAPGGKLYVQTDDDQRNQHVDTQGALWIVDPVARTGLLVAHNLGRPRGLLVLEDGRLVFSDYRHHVLSFFDLNTKTMTPFAGVRDQAGHVNGTGGAARFNGSYDIVRLPDGAILVADQFNHVLRRVTLAGEVTDFAGTGQPGNADGPIATATFDAPQGLAISGGVIYVTDIARHVVRKIENGQVSTFVGSKAGYQDSDDLKSGQLYGVEGIDVDATRLVVSDGNIGDFSNHHHVRFVHLP